VLEARNLLAYGPIEIISINTDGDATGDRASFSSSDQQRVLSDDGRYQVFTSDASDLVAGGDTGRDVYLRDLQLGTTTLISRKRDATPDDASADGTSDEPTISGDGNFVVFASTADDLDVTGVGGTGGTEVFRWQRSTGTIELVSINRDADEGGSGTSDSPSVNFDGSRIAFRSNASDLVAGFVDENSSGGDIYLREMGIGVNQGTTRLVSHADGVPNQTANSSSDRPTITRDGNRIVYETNAGDLEDGVTDVNNTSDDLVTYDVATGENQYVSVQTTQTVGANDTLTREESSLSADGRYQVFVTTASNLVEGDNNSTNDVYYTDLQTGEVTLVSRAVDGGTGSSTSDSASISADGNFIVFRSISNNLDLGDAGFTVSGSRVYRFNRVTGEIELVSINSAGTGGGNSASRNPTISEDGSRIAYESSSTDLVTGINDVNATATDIFVWTAGSGNSIVSFNSQTPTETANRASTDPVISRDGSRIVYRSTASDLDAGATDGNGSTRDLVAFTIDTSIPAGGTNQYVNVLSTNPITGNASSSRTEQSLSADGRYEVFSSTSYNVVTGDTNLASDVFLRDLQTGTTTLVSRGVDGPANRASQFAVISSDGNFVAFESTAQNLDTTGPTGTDGNRNIYRWQRDTGEIRLVSVNSALTGGGNRTSSSPSISEDGDRVAFETSANNLVNGIDANFSQDIYVRTISTGETGLVSHAASDPLTESGAASFAPVISRDGTRITYRSQAQNLEAGVTDINLSGTDIVSHHIEGNTNVYVSVETDEVTTGNAGVRDNSSRPTLSNDGRWEVFVSRSSNLVANDPNNSDDVFLRDHQNGTTTLVSRAVGGATSNNVSNSASISGNGRYVVFTSASTNLDVAGPNGVNFRQNVYRYDRVADELILVSVNQDDTAGGNSTSTLASVSDDGNLIAFTSSARDLVAGVTSRRNHVYLRDVSSETTTLVTRSVVEGVFEANGSTSGLPLISRNGQRIVFESTSTDLDENATDSNQDLYVYNVAVDTVDLVSISADGVGSADRSTDAYGISANGNVVVFGSDAQNLHPLATTIRNQIYARDLTTGTTELISINSDADAAGSSQSQFPSVSDDGRYVAFQSSSSNLVSGGNSTQQIYVRDRDQNTTTLISVDRDGNNPANDRSEIAQISGDGQRVTFLSEATNLTATTLSLTNRNDVYVRNWLAESPVTTLVSDGESTDASLSANGNSLRPQISQRGERVSFFSNATDLDPTIADINGGILDLFSFDGTTVTTTSVTDSSRQTLESGVADFDVSEDGLTIAFSSNARGVINADEVNGSSQVYVRRLSEDPTVAPVTDLVSVSTDGVEGNGSSSQPSIDGDGELVAFSSTATNLTAIADSSGRSDIFVRNLSAATTTFVSLGIDADGDVIPANGSSSNPVISHDGDTVAFHSTSNNLIPESDFAFTGFDQAYTRNWRSAVPQNQLISAADSGNEAGNQGVLTSRPLGLSDDGSTIVFESNSTNLDDGVADTNRTTDIFAYTTEILTVTASDGGTVTSPNGAGSQEFVIDDGADSIVFTSSAPGFVEQDGIGATQVILRNLETQTNEVISVTAEGGFANSTSFQPSISGDGRFVAFTSFASNLPGGSGNGHVYVRDRDDRLTTHISVNAAGVPANGSDHPAISHGGNTVVFQSSASNLLPDELVDENGRVDIFASAWRSETPTTQLISVNADGSGTADFGGTEPTLSDNGSVVVFVSRSANLVDGIPLLNTSDLYVSNAAGVSHVATSTGGGYTINAGDSFDVSDDGQYVAFTSTGRGVDEHNKRDNGRRSYRRDVIAGTTELASINEFRSDGDSGDDISLSGDGRYYAFQGSVFTNGRTGVLVRDFAEATTTVISVPSDGADTINSTASNPVISDDGQVVVFQSTATNLDPNITADSGTNDVFVRDWLEDTPATQLISLASAGNRGGNSSVSSSAISRDGTSVTFVSSSSNLIENDVNATATDIFAVRGVGLVVTPPRITEGDDGTVQLDFEITLLNPPASDVTVDYTTADGTATIADDDYEAATGSLTFNSATSTQTVSITVNSDRQAENDETIEFLLSNVVGTEILTPSVLGTIVNDDSTISIADSQIIEGNDGQRLMQFTVTQFPPSGQTVTVDFVTSDGSATAGEDYQATTGTLTLEPGQATGVIQVPVLGDTDPEGNETLTVTLSDATNTVIETGTAIGTIQNDDAVITFEDIAFVEGNSTRSVSTLVRISQPIASDLTFNYELIDESAIAGEDFVAATGSLTIPAGQRTVRVPIDIVGDSVAEADETLTLRLTNIVGIATETASQDITIRDDDVRITVNDVSVLEGDSGGTPVNFVITLSQASPVPVTLQVQTADGSALSTQDYDSFPLTDVTFDPGETEQTITVQVRGDTDLESNESFFLQLSNSVGGIIDDSQGRATIINDDGGVSVSDVAVVEGDEDTTAAIFTLTLSGSFSEAVTVDFTVSDDTATAGVDYVDPGVVPVSFAAGETTQTVAVTINGDTDVEPFETFQANLSNIGGATGANIDDGVGVATIQNDDAELTLIANDSREGDTTSRTLTFDTRLTHPVVQGVTATLTITSGTATADDDFLPRDPVTLSFTSGTTLVQTPISTIADTMAEPHETVLGQLSDVSDGVVISSQATASILNDDAVFRISDASVTEGDGGNIPIQFDVELEQPVAFATSLAFDTLGGTATSDVDFRPLSSTLSFGADQTSQTITIDVIGDLVPEDDETFTVGISDPSSGTIAVATATGTIIDDDTVAVDPELTLTFDSTIVLEGDSITGTVTRNFTDGMPLEVVLTVDVADQLAAPINVVIGANQLSATFTLPTIDNGLVERARTVVVTARGDGFPDDSRELNINDDDRPSLSLSFQPDAISEFEGTSTATVSRTGNLTQPLDVVLQNTDRTEIMIPAGVTIPAGSSSTTFTIGSVDDFLFDGDQSVSITARPTFAAGGLVNSGGTSASITVTDNDVAEFTATAMTQTNVAVVEDTVRPTITITGIATFTGGGPVMMQDVSVFIESRGTLRTLTATTDATGNYSIDFVPLPGEAGIYEISAGEPGTPVPETASDSFEILAFRSTNVSSVLATAGQTVSSRALTLLNAAQRSLTNVTATILSDAIDDVTISLDFDGSASIDSMSAGSGVPVTMTVLADASVSASADVIVRFESSEGTFIDRVIPVTIRPSAANLVLRASTLSTTIIRGRQTLATFTVTNTGGTATNDLSMLIPDGVDWISSAIDPPITPIQPGQTRTLTVQLNPPDDLPLGSYMGTITLTDGTVGLNVPLDIDVTGQQTGTLALLVEDDFTINDDAAGVVGATVTIVNAGTRDTVFSGSVTDSAGLIAITDLPEGTYQVLVEADDHLPAENLITVVPGITNQVTVFLPVQVVDYRFTVTETEIEDRTRITVETLFNSTVPAPVLRLVPDQTDLTTRPFIDGTEQLNFTLQNDGLIALNDLQIRLPQHPAYEFETVSTQLGSLAAGQTIVLPVVVRRTSIGVPTAPPLGPVWVNLDADYTYLVKPKNQPSFTVGNRSSAIIRAAIPVGSFTPQLPKVGSGGFGGGYWSGGSNRIGGGGGGVGGGSFNRGTSGFGGSPSITLPVIPVPDDGGVPVEVRVQLTNDVVQTRQAFDAALEIDNGSTLQMRDFTADLIVFDQVGNDVSDLFGITSPIFTGFGLDQDSRTLETTETGAGQWTLIPSLDASNPQPTTYFVGGSFSYMLGEVEFSVDLTLVDFVVSPQPELYLDYFWQRDAVSDDPFTRDRIEPAVPGDLVVRVQNRGDGVANNLQVIGYQPQIIENEQGLAISFVILSTEVNDTGVEPSLTANIGKLAPGETAIVRWQLISTLQGIFNVDPTATTITHESSIDGTNRLSLIPEMPGIFNLIHVTRDYGDEAGDTLLDFLTDEIDQIDTDIHDDDGIPDTIRFSDVDSSPQPVGAFENPIFDRSPTATQPTATLSVDVPDSQWNYTSVLFPEQPVGFVNWRIDAVRRSDGTLLPIENTWMSDRTFPPSGGRPTYENRIHLVDRDSTGNYTFTFATLIENPPTVSGVIVQNGDVSRAIINTFAVQFDQEMDLQSLIEDGTIHQAVSLLNLGVDTETDTDVAVDLLTGQFAYEAGVLTWSLPPNGSRASSLPDGLYQLTLDAEAIRGSGGQRLDGDADGQAGGDFVTTFHRLAADTDGNAIVDQDDVDLVDGNLGRRAGFANYDSNADLDGDGRITVRDRVIAFRSRNRSISSPTPVAASTSRFDATADGRITALDALVVVNQLARLSAGGEGELTADLDNSLASLDVNRDGRVTALDALQVINEISVRNRPIDESMLFANGEQTVDAAFVPSALVNRDVHANGDDDEELWLAVLAEDQHSIGKF
jgi:hypothetical protein